MAAVCVAAASTGAAAQTQPTLKALVATHGSLAAGDVVFTNFRTPVFPPITMPVPIRAGLALGGGADVAVQALLAADGSIALTLTPIDPATGLPRPLGIDPVTGLAIKLEQFNYVEYDVIVTNPLRRLHAHNGSFGPATKVGFGGTTAFNYGYFFDASNLNQYTQASADAWINNIEIYNVGAVPLAGGDRAGARFAAYWGLLAPRGNSVDGTLDSVTMRYSLAAASPPAIPAPLAIASFFADAVYLNAPAPVGGASITLSSNDPASLVVPASVTVPQGAFYSAYRAIKQPVLNVVSVTVSGTFRTNISTAQETVWVGEAVGSAPLPLLTVALNGKGKVVSFDRSINCGTVCSTTPSAGPLNGFAEQLTATAGSGSVFTAWTGACSGTAPTCNVIVNGQVNVGATFTALAGGGGGGGGGGKAPVAP